MTVTTYGGLKTAIASYIERSDLTSQIVDAITLAQNKMYRGVMGMDGRTWIVPPLRVRDMITTANISVTSGAGSLPSGWLEFVRLWIDATDQPNLEYLPPQDFYKYQGAHEASAGAPVTGYTIEGATIRTLPPNTETLKSVHYAQFAAMSGDSDADWVLTNAPYVYLHGALSEIWAFIAGHDAEEQKHAAAFAAGVAGLNAQYNRAQVSGSALMMRPRAVA